MLLQRIKMLVKFYQILLQREEPRYDEDEKMTEKRRAITGKREVRLRFFSLRSRGDWLVFAFSFSSAPEIRSIEPECPMISGSQQRRFLASYQEVTKYFVTHQQPFDCDLSYPKLISKRIFFPETNWKQFWILNCLNKVHISFTYCTSYINISEFDL